MSDDFMIGSENGGFMRKKNGPLRELVFAVGTAWTGFTTILQNICNWRLCLLLCELLDSLQRCVCNIGISMSLIFIRGAFPSLFVSRIWFCSLPFQCIALYYSFN